MKLRCTGGSFVGESFELDSSKEYLLGREPTEEGLESIALPSPTVSRKHCKIYFQDGEAFVEDLQSANGIRVNKNKVSRVRLKDKDQLDIGAYRFVVQDAGSARSTQTREPQTDKRPQVQLPAAVQSLEPQVQKARALWSRFEKLDIKLRILSVVLVVGAIAHFGITAPLMSDTRISLLKLSFSIAENAARSLANRNKRELAEGQLYLLDCDVLKQSTGIISATLYDSKGRGVCPVGVTTIQDELLENALYRGEGDNNCKARMILGSETSCDFVYPIREWKDQQGQYVTVGVARVRYEPQDAELAVQNLQTLRWKTFIFCMGLMLVIWWIWGLWTRRDIALAVEGVHLAVTGVARNVENLESFAALDPLIQEVNRLISKENQGLAGKSENLEEQASFLHSLLQQVLLLEERAVMVVDKDNHLIASSRSLPEAIPVEVDRMNIHITEAVVDTHLQGELIVLLNDLAQSSDVIDRALSLADRVVQARGMPLYLREDFVASILLF